MRIGADGAGLTGMLLLSVCALGIPTTAVAMALPQGGAAGTAVGAVVDLEPTVTPTPRAWAAQSEFLFQGGVILHGGYDPATASSLDDLWVFRNGSWAPYPTTPGFGPGSRSGHAITVDPIGAELMLFGGFQSGLPAGRITWTLDLNTKQWSLASSTGPHPRSDHTMVHDLARSETILFGGFDLWQFVPLNDLWVWSNGSWVQRQTVGSPPARSAHAMVADPQRDGLWLFGGYNSAGNPLGDTWFLDLSTMTWTQQVGGPAPSPRAWANMSFDAAQQTVVLQGGLTAGGAGAADLWCLDHSGWRQVITQGPVPARDSAVFAFDHHTETFVLFGGFTQVNGNSHVTGTTHQVAVAAVPGAGVPVGRPCPAAWPSTRLGVQGNAQIGTSVSLQLDGMPGAAGIALVGLGSNVQGGLGIPLPMALGEIGLPRCKLRTDIQLRFTVPYLQGTAGSTLHSLTVPNDPTLVGRAVTLQFMAVSTGGDRAVSNAWFQIVKG